MTHATNATTGTETMTTTPTTRHETLADAFLFSATEGGVIFGNGWWGRSDYHAVEFYVVPFASIEWAEGCGMQIVTDFSGLM